MSTLPNSEHEDQIYGLNLLLIEDDDDDAFEVMSVLLEDPRVHSVRRAGDGLEAMEWLADKRSETDLIVCDINMPRMNGFEFLTRIQGTRNPPPVVILTASGRGEDYHRSLMRDAATYIRKPDTHQTLVDVLNVMICSYQLRQKMPPLLAA
jgi:CheY-like chemotaxis protein